MAKTTEKPARKQPRKSVAGPATAPERPWNAGALIAAIEAGSMADKVARLKTIGILTPTGKLAKRYRSWGTNVSRTPELDEQEPAITKNDTR